MAVKKTMLSLVRLVLPGLGFGLTCMGIYLVSLQNGSMYAWSVIPAYIMVVVGFLVTLVGGFWTICQSMKSKMYQRGGHQQQIEVYTIDRPSSYPPSYEESQSSHVSPDTVPEFVVTVDGVDMVMSLAPPLYTQDSSEVPDCTWSWEQPPSYSQVERVDTEERREALSER